MSWDGGRLRRRGRRGCLVAATRAPAVLVAGLACWATVSGPPAEAQAPAPTISIDNSGFSPSSATTPMGPPEPGFLLPHAHAQFVNNGDTQHNVTFDDTSRVESSPTLNPNQFFNAVFTGAGSFSYRCSIHPSMTGTITVTPLPTTTTTTTTTEPPTAPPTTPPPATATPPTTTPRTSVTTRPVAGAVKTTTTPPTTAAPTTAAPTTAPVETTTSPAVTDPSSTTTTTGAVRGTNLAARSEPSDSPHWSVFILVLVLAGGAAAFAARTVVQRRSKD